MLEHIEVIFKYLPDYYLTPLHIHFIVDRLLFFFLSFLIAWLLICLLVYFSPKHCI